jgi:decaprenylphospho-beta-D-ribofuranose 2-oxidase
MKIEKRSGWGRASSIRSKTLLIEQFGQVESTQESNSGLAVGLGRSYGDSSLNSRGLSWSCLSKKEIVIDSSRQEANCGSGVTIGELERAAAKKNLFPPVVPGTEFVTIGGAIASNIHGKSHHCQGAFGDHVHEISLLDSTGTIHQISPETNSELFWATIGGMGLTGVILSAKISLIPIENEFIFVEEQRSNSLDGLLNLMKEFDSKYMYTVAWIDISGNYKGRGIVSGGRHATTGELPSIIKNKSTRTSVRRSMVLPDIFPPLIINKYSVRAFSSFWFHKRLKFGIVHYRKFMHPLDSISGWNKIYGRKGFVQYQVQIPFGKEDFIYELLSTLKKIKVASFLGVVKQFGVCGGKYLSFPSEGWTIAVDIPMQKPELFSTLKILDEKLCKVGGKVYLTKDIRLSYDHFIQMYPKISEWKEIKKRIDPDNYWQSDQGKRLNLC